MRCACRHSKISSDINAPNKWCQFYRVLAVLAVDWFPWTWTLLEAKTFERTINLSEATIATPEVAPSNSSRCAFDCFHSWQIGAEYGGGNERACHRLRLTGARSGDAETHPPHLLTTSADAEIDNDFIYFSYSHLPIEYFPKLNSPCEHTCTPNIHTYYYYYFIFQSACLCHSASMMRNR